MLITKSEDVTVKQGFCKVLWRKLRLREGLLLSLIGVLWEGVGWEWALIRGWALINFSAFRMGAYSRWALIQGWALNRINTVFIFWNNWVSDTSFYGFINHFGKLDVMLLIFSRELLHTTKMGSQLTGPLSSCWNSTALTPGLSLVYKISFPCLYFYIAAWSLIW